MGDEFPGELLTRPSGLDAGRFVGGGDFPLRVLTAAIGAPVCPGEPNGSDTRQEVVLSLVDPEQVGRRALELRQVWKA